MIGRDGIPNDSNVLVTSPGWLELYSGARRKNVDFRKLPYGPALPYRECR